MKLGALILLGTLTAASSAMAQTSRDDFNTNYGMLTDRNPFMRERRRPVPPVVRNPNWNNGGRTNRRSTYTLRGIAIEDEQLHAYLESTRGGEITRVSPGDSFAEGKVVQIDIDAIAFESGGQVRWIEIGDDLTGNRGGSPTPTSQPDTSTQPAGATPPPLPPGGGSLEERMKARRAQQHGNK